MATFGVDNPSSRKVARDLTLDNLRVLDKTLQLPRVDTSSVPAGTLKGKLVQDTTDQGIYYSELKVSPDGYVWSKLGLAADTSVRSFIIAREDPAVPVIITGAGPIASGEPWVSGTALNDALESLGGSGNITIDASGDFFTLGAVVDADAAGSYVLEWSASGNLTAIPAADTVTFEFGVGVGGNLPSVAFTQVTVDDFVAKAPYRIWNLSGSTQIDLAVGDDIQLYYHRSDFAKHPSHSSSSVITDHTHIIPIPEGTDIERSKT